MRAITVLICLAAALIAAPAAAAKEITKVNACGTSGCVSTHDDAILQGLMNGGPPTVPPRVEGGVIRLTATVTEPGHGVVGRFKSWWVPSSQLLVGEDGTWMPLGDDATTALERVTQGLTPFPASKLGLTAAPADRPAPPARGDDGGGGGSAGWIVAALALAGLAAAAAFVVRRRPGGDFPVPAP